MSSQTPTDVSYSTDTEQRTTAVDTTELFNALANERRQFVIRAVADAEQTIGDLAEQLARAEHDLDDDDHAVDSTLRKRTYVALYQQHLEVLEELDIIRWNEHADAITAGSAHGRALQTLQFATAEDEERLVADGGHTLLDSTIEELGDEYDEEFIRDAIEAIEDSDVEPTVERIESVLIGVQSEINAAVEKLPIRSPEGGESA